MQDRIFYAAGFGFTLGVLLRSFFTISFWDSALAALILLGLLLFFILSRSKRVIIGTIFLTAVFLGVTRLAAHEASLPVPVARENMTTILTGELTDAPDVRTNSQKLTVQAEVNGRAFKILATTNLEEEFKYGDKVRISGELEIPESFLTDQGKVFDYASFLRKDGIIYTMNFIEVEILSRGHGNRVKSFLFAVKDKLLKSVNLAIPAPESLLLGGLILGERSPFSAELRENFIRTGTIHIVALSGYNVMIVADWIMKIFGFLRPGLAFGAGIFAIFLFVLMTGGISTAVRAGIMASLALLARATGRTAAAGRALLVAAVAMIFWNPLILVYDVSFQLSFLATVAVIFFAPKMERYFLWVPEIFKLREVVTLTCAAYIFVLPFILYQMGNLSLVALPANILILPFIPLTMGLGFFTSLLGVVWHPLATPLGFFSTLALRYELWVIDFFSGIVFASISVPNFPLALTLLIYAGFIYQLFWADIKKFFTAPF